MKLIRVAGVPFLILALTSCQAGENLLRMPVNLFKTVLSPIGRTVGLTSDNTRTENDMHIEAREVHNAVAANKAGSVSATPVANDAAVALR